MTCSPQSLYRDTRNVHQTLYLDGKNRAMVCSLRLCTRTLPRFNISAHSLHAQTNTNALYCRAVRSKRRAKNEFEFFILTCVVSLFDFSCWPLFMTFCARVEHQYFLVLINILSWNLTLRLLLTRTIKAICLSQFLHSISTVNKITL